MQIGIRWLTPGFVLLAMAGSGVQAAPEARLHGAYRLQGGTCPREGYDYLIHIKERAMVLPDYGCFRVNWTLVKRSGGVEHYSGEAECHVWDGKPDNLRRTFQAVVNGPRLSLVWMDGTKSGDFIRCK